MSERRPTDPDAEWRDVEGGTRKELCEKGKDVNRA